LSPQFEPVRGKVKWQRSIRSTPSWYVNQFPHADRQFQEQNETVRRDGDMKPELLAEMLYHPDPWTSAPRLKLNLDKFQLQPQAPSRNHCML